MKVQDWPRLFVVDVEGNGIARPDLVELAAVPVVGGEVDTAGTAAWLVRPPRPVTAGAARVHGLSNRLLATRPPFARVEPEVRALLEGAWICAHNARFDYDVLTRHLPGWRPPGVLDTLRLARVCYPRATRHTLDALIRLTGVDVSGAPGRRHRAGYDAHATARLLLAMAERWAGWDEFAAVAVPPGLPGRPEPDHPTLW